MQPEHAAESDDQYAVERSAFSASTQETMPQATDAAARAAQEMIRRGLTNREEAIDFITAHARRESVEMTSVSRAMSITPVQRRPLPEVVAEAMDVSPALVQPPGRRIVSNLGPLAMHNNFTFVQLSSPYPPSSPASSCAMRPAEVYLPPAPSDAARQAAAFFAGHKEQGRTRTRAPAVPQHAARGLSTSAVRPQLMHMPLRPADAARQAAAFVAGRSRRHELEMVRGVMPKWPACVERQGAPVAMLDGIAFSYAREDLDMEPTPAAARAVRHQPYGDFIDQELFADFSGIHHHVVTSSRAKGKRRASDASSSGASVTFFKEKATPSQGQGHAERTSPDKSSSPPSIPKTASSHTTPPEAGSSGTSRTAASEDKKVAERVGYVLSREPQQVAKKLVELELTNKTLCEQNDLLRSLNMHNEEVIEDLTEEKNGLTTKVQDLKEQLSIAGDQDQVFQRLQQQRRLVWNADRKARKLSDKMMSMQLEARLARQQVESHAKLARKTVSMADKWAQKEQEQEWKQLDSWKLATQLELANRRNAKLQRRLDVLEAEQKAIAEEDIGSLF